ncbi:LysR family transcriptional regulator [Nitrincola iocasae]|uniref:LysR family transcriptional regulator n=1 Tax=Nitrincola iocasae TaxID=2614693 RepID=A0A5J6LC52_9GAMM|nr:LysR family transcriptional regulator [Nitrincola iocasae]QEW06167.1 LysR family transcriptional regulator [Nitrincola iocasae]
MSELGAMKCLVALKQHGSLSSAADYLQMPKSTLSRRIAVLEQQLGHRLTRQNGRKLLLTSAGLKFVDYAEGIIELMVKGQKALHEEYDSLEGVLHIGLCQELSRGWSTEVLNRFRQANPGVSLHIHQLDHVDAHEASFIDLWISCCDREISDSTNSVLLARWEQGLYRSATTNIENQFDIPETASWVRSPNETGEVKLYNSEGHCHFTYMPTSVVRISSMHMRADAISQGFGVGLLPSWVAECKRYGLKNLRRVMPLLRGKEVYLRMYQRAECTNPTVLSLKKWIQQQVPPKWTSQ